MVMGMTYEQYWDGDPHMAVAYRKAYRLRREAENESLWLQGLYVFDAFSAVLSNAFAKPGAKRQTYLERPIDLFPLTEQEKKLREAQEKEKMQRAMEAMISKQRQRKKTKGD